MPVGAGGSRLCSGRLALSAGNAGTGLPKCSRLSRSTRSAALPSRLRPSSLPCVRTCTLIEPHFTPLPCLLISVYVLSLSPPPFPPPSLRLHRLRLFPSPYACTPAPLPSPSSLTAPPPRPARPPLLPEAPYAGCHSPESMRAGLQVGECSASRRAVQLAGGHLPCSGRTGLIGRLTWGFPTWIATTVRAAPGQPWVLGSPA